VGAAVSRGASPASRIVRAAARWSRDIPLLATREPHARCMPFTRNFKLRKHCVAHAAFYRGVGCRQRDVIARPDAAARRLDECMRQCYVTSRSAFEEPAPRAGDEAPGGDVCCGAPASSSRRKSCAPEGGRYTIDEFPFATPGIDD